MAGPALASNIIRVDAPIAKGNPWVSANPTVSAWTNVADPYECQFKTPDATTVTFGYAFTQDLSGCKQDQTQTTQKNVKNTSTGEIKAVGEPVVTSRTVSDATMKVSAIGTGASEWSPTSPTVSAWVNSGAPYECSGKTPLESEIAKGVSFTQTLSGCKQLQTNTTQANEKSSVTGAIRPVGNAVAGQQVLTNQAGTQTAIGTMESAGFTASIVSGALDQGATKGVGYRRQQNGVYSFGTSMTGFGSLPVTAGMTLYLGSYGMTVVSGTENVSAPDYADVTAARNFLSPYTRVKLLSSDGTVAFIFTLGEIGCQRGYCQRGVGISVEEFNKWFSNPGLVTQVQLLP